jgi:hypothetical protein
MKYDAKINIVERENKKGEKYQMLEIYMTTKTGEVILIHEVYMRETLATLIRLVSEK